MDLGTGVGLGAEIGDLGRDQNLDPADKSFTTCAALLALHSKVAKSPMPGHS